MAVSTMAAIKANLKALIVADAAFSGVQVTYGDAGGSARYERVWLGATEIGASEPPAFRSGKQRRRESYTLHVLVEVIKPGGTPEAVEARAIALASAVEDIVANDPKVSNTPGLLFARCEGLELDTVEHAEGPVSLVDVSIYCEGDIL